MPITSPSGQGLQRVCSEWPASVVPPHQVSLSRARSSLTIPCRILLSIRGSCEARVGFVARRGGGKQATSPIV